MLDLPRFKAAAVQAAPVFLNTAATVEKAIGLMEEAARNGARLIALPEVFIPGYPYWNWLLNPVEGSPWYEKLLRASILVPGAETDALCAAARRLKIHVVVGVNERVDYSLGVIFNTVLTIDEDGKLIGRHRKLVPTWAEKLTWTPGDAAGLRVHRTAIGPLGALACGENTNTLARFALLAQGELVHVANYIALPVAPPDYDMADAIRVRAAAHAFEGKVYTIVSCSTVSEEIIAAMETVKPGAREMLTRKNGAFSGILGPDGRVSGEPLIDKEGIAYADIDLSRCIQGKQMHDIVGHYNRFDVFKLSVDGAPLAPIQWRGRSGDPAPTGPIGPRVPGQPGSTSQETDDA